LLLSIAGVAQSGNNASELPRSQRPRGPRVDVICPIQPVPVPINTKKVLVYELHITNFDTKPLSLQQVAVLGDDASKPPLAIYSGTVLKTMLSQVGAAMGAKETTTIAPGQRIVAFFWIEVDKDKAAPIKLHHRLTFSAPDSDSATALPADESVLDDFSVAVSGQEVPQIYPPFAGGTWLAGNGPSNESAHRRGLIALDGQVHIAQRFAIDWIKVGPNGNSYHDAPDHNENWWGYGEPIHSVTDGEVSEVVDGISENTPRVLPKEVALRNIAGNYVVVRIGPKQYLTYAHLQPGSIKVQPHQQVHHGDIVARLGNSGQATAPHLHLQLTDGDAVLASEGLPFTFAHFQYLGPGSQYELDHHPSTLWTGSIPAGDAVIEFPAK